ncbi:MAG: hypothetical protein PUE25_06680 [bacterium]|nr:hypothetical protein [bacterium]
MEQGKKEELQQFFDMLKSSSNDMLELITLLEESKLNKYKIKYGKFDSNSSDENGYFNSKTLEIVYDPSNDNSYEVRIEEIVHAAQYELGCMPDNNVNNEYDAKAFTAKVSLDCGFSATALSMHANGQGPLSEILAGFAKDENYLIPEWLYFKGAYQFSSAAKQLREPFNYQIVPNKISPFARKFLVK